jgi:hypothetical protein
VDIIMITENTIILQLKILMVDGNFGEFFKSF